MWTSSKIAGGALLSSVLLLLQFSSVHTAAVPPTKVVSRASAPNTNGQRFQRGLPPLPPRRRRTDSARRAVPSNVVCAALTSTTGNIAVEDSTGALVGFVDVDDAAQGGLYTLQPLGQGTPLVVTLPANAPYMDNFPIKSTNAQGYTYFGLIADGEDGRALTPNNEQSNCLFTGIQNEVPAGSTATLGAADYSGPQVGETNIWSLDCMTLELKTQWINDDLSTPTNYISDFNGGSFLVVTAVPNADFGTTVKFRFVPLL